MKTTALALAAMAATATAAPTFNVRSAEPSHVHLEFEDLGFRSAHTGGEKDAEVTFYQVSTGESLFQLTTGETTSTLQYLDHQPIVSKSGSVTSAENMVQMKAAGTLHAHVAGHEALHSHPVFSKYIAKLSQAAGKEGIQGNTHPAAMYLHQKAMMEMKRGVDSHGAFPHRLDHVTSGLPTNLNAFSKGDEFAYDETSESFIQNLQGGQEEWGGIAGAAEEVWDAGVAVVNGAVNIVNGLITIAGTVISTVWDVLTDPVGAWQTAVHWINVYNSITSGGGGAMPIGEIAQFAWWNFAPGWTGARNNGRRRRRRRQVIQNLGQQYRPFFDNRNRLWSRLARCLDGLAMPSGNSGGSPCFGICGPGCVCFIWHCGSCLRAYRGCWEHDCACMKSCSNGGDGGAAWDAYICWLFTANLNTCADISCIVHLCSNDNNHNNENDTNTFDDGDCTGVLFVSDNWSGGTSRYGVPQFGGADSYGAHYNSEYVVWGVNFPKRGPGGLLCWQGQGPHADNQGPNPVPQTAYAGGGSFSWTEPQGLVDPCYSLLGKTAMQAEQEIDGFRPYGDVFDPTVADLNALGYNTVFMGLPFANGGSLFNAVHMQTKIRKQVKWPGCGIDSARIAMNYKAAQDHWETQNGVSFSTVAGNGLASLYTEGGGINYRPPYDGTDAMKVVSFAMNSGGNTQNGSPDSQASWHCLIHSSKAKYSWTHIITPSPTAPPTKHPTYPTKHPTAYPTANAGWGPCCLPGPEMEHYDQHYGLTPLYSTGQALNIAVTIACTQHTTAQACNAQQFSWVPTNNNPNGQTNTAALCQFFYQGTDAAIMCPNVQPHTLPTSSPTNSLLISSKNDPAAYLGGTGPNDNFWAAQGQNYGQAVANKMAYASKNKARIAAGVYSGYAGSGGGKLDDGKNEDKDQSYTGWGAGGGKNNGGKMKSNKSKRNSNKSGAK